MFVCLYLSNMFLTSCLLALFSAVPECHQPLGGSRTLWRRERWDTHAHRKQHSHTSHILMHPHAQHFCMHVCIHSSVPWGTREDLPICALSEMISLFSQPFKPINTVNFVSGHIEAHACFDSACNNVLCIKQLQITHHCLYVHSFLLLQTGLEDG